MKPLCETENVNSIKFMLSVCPCYELLTIAFLKTYIINKSYVLLAET